MGKRQTGNTGNYSGGGRNYDGQGHDANHGGRDYGGHGLGSGHHHNGHGHGGNQGGHHYNGGQSKHGDGHNNHNTDSRRLLPDSLIRAAATGDVEAINKVLKHFEGYIIALSMKRVVDEDGRAYTVIDDETRRMLETKLIVKITRFARSISCGRLRNGNTKPTGARPCVPHGLFVLPSG